MTLQKLRAAARIVIIFFLALIIGEGILVFIARYLSDFLAERLNVSKIENIPVGDRLTISDGLLWAFILMVIWAPLIEETVFRLWLRYSVQKAIISASVAATLLIAWMIHSSVSIRMEAYVVAVLVPLVTIACYWGLWKVRKVLPNTLAGGQQRVIVFSSVLFGVFHLSNFNLAPSQWLVGLPLTLPQIFAGFLFSKARVNHGFAYGIVIHALTNFTALAASML